MNASKQATWLFLALISLACAGWYFASSKPVVKLDDKTLSTSVDAIITDLTIHQYNTDGRLVNYLKTPLVHHIPLNNTHWLKTPLIIVTQTNQPPWEIRSQQATSLYGGEQVTFTKNVIIHQQKHEHTPESTLKTEEITYFPKDEVAMSSKKVTFEQAGSLIQSIGMKAYLAEKRVQLLSQARGTYEPGHG